MKGWIGMYCKKLYNILQDNDHITYNITETDIEKLDEFIRNKTTSRERLNLDPARLSIIMKMNYEKSIKLFVLCCKQKLFKMKMYIDCEYCNSRHNIEDFYVDIICDESNKTIPINNNKDKIYVYFELLERPQICKKINANNSYMIDDIMGKCSPSNTTLSEMEKYGITFDTIGSLMDAKFGWN